MRGAALNRCTALIAPPVTTTVVGQGKDAVSLAPASLAFAPSTATMPCFKVTVTIARELRGSRPRIV
jgi:hypothetical protein